MLWSPNVFKKLLDDTYKYKDRRQANQHRHILRQIVMETTVADVQRQSYNVPESSAAMARMLNAIGSKAATKRKSVPLDNQSHSTTYFTGQSRQPYQHVSVPVAPAAAPRTRVVVVKLDCLEVAHQLAVKDGLNPVVLNMANATKPGGGYLRGDGAQEENLFRRSNYYLALDEKLNNVNKNYPIGGVFAGLSRDPNPYERDAVYTKGITVFRGTEKEGYPYLQEPVAHHACVCQMQCLRFRCVLRSLMCVVVHGVELCIISNVLTDVHDGKCGRSHPSRPYQVSLIATAAYRWPVQAERWDLFKDRSSRAAAVRTKSKIDLASENKIPFLNQESAR